MFGVSILLALPIRARPFLLGAAALLALRRALPCLRFRSTRFGVTWPFGARPPFNPGRSTTGTLAMRQTSRGGRVRRPARLSAAGMPALSMLRALR
jgi:hypothetical protein